MVQLPKVYIEEVQLVAQEPVVTAPVHREPVAAIAVADEADTASELPDYAQDERHTADLDAAAEKFKERILADSGIVGGVDASTQPTQTAVAVPAASVPVIHAADTVLAYLKPSSALTAAFIRSGDVAARHRSVIVIA